MMKALKIVSAVAISTLLFSCGKSPEAAADKLVDKACDCSKIYQEASIKADDKLIEELKKGTFKTQMEVLDYQAKNIPNDAKTCNDELDKLQKEMLVDFPEENDRQTIKNSAKAKAEASDCTKDLTEKKKKKQAEVEALVSKLPIM